MKRVFLLAALSVLSLAIARGAFACGCPTPYCKTVGCTASGCFGQVSVCTCTGPLACTVCENLGKVKCCNDTYTLYEDNINKTCPRGCPVRPSAKLQDGTSVAERVYLPTCAGGYVQNTKGPSGSSGEGRDQ
jgi:hypothetical protein